MRHLAIALGCTALLAGCASAPPQQSGGPQEPLVLQQTTTVAAKRAKIHTELGSAYLLRGSLGVALQEARTAVSDDANYAPAHNLLGLVQMKLHQNRLAEQSFRRALALSPSDPDINNDYGWFLCDTNHPRRSMKYFEKAFNDPLYATPTMPYTNAGICSFRLKNYQAAKHYFLEALRTDRNNDRAVFFLADTAYRMGDFATARRRLSQLHQMVQPTAITLWLAVRVERKLGDDEAEARYADELRRRFPNSPQAQRLNLGRFE